MNARDAKRNQDRARNGIRVGLYLDVASGFYRRLALGARAYTREHPELRLQVISPGYLGTARIRKLGLDGYRGVLGAITDAKGAAICRKISPRVITMSNAAEIRGLTKVASDDIQVGRLGARHLLEQGYRALAFVGSGVPFYSHLRQRGFRECAEAAGATVQVFAEPQALLPALPTKTPPRAVFCEADSEARALIEQLGIAGYRVPEDLVVMGVDDDPFQCSMSHVPITSVVLAAERIGYDAMRLLHAWILGRRPPRPRVLIPPTHVEVRRSTDMLAVSEPQMANWLAFLADHLPEIRTAAAFARRVGVSRRVLERRFREAIDRGVYQEMTRQRVNRAITHMRETAWPLQRIADECGFGDARTFSLTFRRLMGETPAAYRRRLGNPRLLL